MSLLINKYYSLSFCAVIAFILFTGTIIVLAQEITGWTTPSALFTDPKWRPFFNEVANSESIGGNAGASSFGVNFYIDYETGLVPLYKEKGVIKPLVGNFQNLPKSLTSEPRLINVTARIEITDWRTGGQIMREIISENNKKFPPAINKMFQNGIKKYNASFRSIMSAAPELIAAEKLTAEELAKMGKFTKGAKFIGRWGGRLIGVYVVSVAGVEAYYQVKDLETGEAIAKWAPYTLVNFAQMSDPGQIIRDLSDVIEKQNQAREQKNTAEDEARRIYLQNLRQERIDKECVGLTGHAYAICEQRIKKAIKDVEINILRQREAKRIYEAEGGAMKEGIYEGLIPRIRRVKKSETKEIDSDLQRKIYYFSKGLSRRLFKTP